MASSPLGLGLNWGSSGLCQPHMQKQNAKEMRSWSSRTVQHFALVFMLRLRYMQVTHAPDEPWLIWLFWFWESPKTPKFSPMPGSRWRRFWDLWCISVGSTQMSEWNEFAWNTKFLAKWRNFQRECSCTEEGYIFMLQLSLCTPWKIRKSCIGEYVFKGSTVPLSKLACFVPYLKMINIFFWN